MDDILGQILIFIPVILIVFVRMYLEKARKNRQESRMLPGGHPIPDRSGTGGSILSSLFGGPVRKERPGGMGLSSGGNSSRQEREARPAEIPPILRDGDSVMRTPRPSPASRYSVPAYDYTATERVVAVAPGSAVGSIGKSTGGPDAPDRADDAAPRAEPGLPAHLDRLPALKRAVVMSEILGKPKGLSGSPSAR